MNYAILRVQKRTLPQARAMAAHALRERPAPNADSQRSDENRVFGASTAAAAHARLRELTDPLAKRRDAVRCVEAFVGMSPEAARPGGPLASPAAQRRYFAAALDMLATRFGGRANLVMVAEHRDETTPHLQVLIAPIERAANGRPMRLAANAMIGGPAGLKQLQDDLGRIAKPFGLRRGERGSRARHTSIKAFYGAIEAAGRSDALPPRVRMPAPIPRPEAPGRLAGAAKRAAYAAEEAAYVRREAERQAAQQASRDRQAEIERLARLGLAVHGRGRRQLPAALSKAEATLLNAQVARQMIERAGEMLDRLTPQQRDRVIQDTRQAVQAPAQDPAAPVPAGPARPGLRRPL